MLRLKITVLIFSAIAILAIFGVFATIRSQPEPTKNEYDQQQPQTEQREAQPNTDSYGQNQPERWTKYKQQIKERWTRFIEFTEKYDKAIVALSTLGIFLFTLALFLATFLLYTAGERHSERQLRAYIFASDVKVRQFTTIPRVTAEFKNFGQTPCDDMIFLYDIQVSAFPIANDLRAGPALRTAPMAPGSSFHRDNSFAVTQEQRSEIDGGRAAIYIFGRIEYRDVFRTTRRHTNFRLVYTGDQFGRTGATEEGNDYS
jgi:hypothetical protein